MGDLEFSMTLKSPISELMNTFLDFEKWPRFLPRQLKSVKILERTENGTTTEEILVFKTIVKNEIIQNTIHKKISENSIQSQVISGPAKGTQSTVLFQDTDSGTKVSVNVELKLSLKAKILSPIIKKVYKIFLRGILLKIDFSILDKEENKTV